VREWAATYGGGGVFLPLQLGQELRKRGEIRRVIAHGAEVGIAVDPVPGAFKLRLGVVKHVLQADDDPTL
jgi:hypothetical protein